jgi:hypothetical protein
MEQQDGADSRKRSGRADDLQSSLSAQCGPVKALVLTLEALKLVQYCTAAAGCGRLLLLLLLLLLYFKENSVLCMSMCISRSQLAKLTISTS